MYKHFLLVSLLTLTTSQLVYASKMPNPTTHTKIKLQDEIVIATEGEYKPFNYINENDQVVGFDIDISHALCTEMKIKCTIVTQHWDGIIPGLIAKKYDVVIAGMGITDKRRRVVDFTQSYFVSSFIYIGRKNQTIDTEQLQHKKIGAQKSTIAADFLKNNITDFRDVKTYDAVDESYNALKANDVDLLLVDIGYAINWLKDEANTDFEQKSKGIADGYNLGIATRKNSPLTSRFDNALSTIKSNGVYQKIYDKHFTIR